jgi:hypothetical protein
MNFSVPFTWGAPEQEDRQTAPAIDPKDRELVAIVKAATTLSAREKALVLVLIQTISAWGGLEDARRAS